MGVKDGGQSTRERMSLVLRRENHSHEEADLLFGALEAVGGEHVATIEVVDVRRMEPRRVQYELVFRCEFGAVDDAVAQIADHRLGAPDDASRHLDEEFIRIERVP